MDRLETYYTTKKKYICVEGTIGSGKTTLCRALADRLGGERGVLGDRPLVQYEPAEGTNPYLGKYYENPERYAFNMQIFLLSKRRRAQMAAQALVLSGQCSVIADRSYFGDRCFAEVQRELGYFSENDFKTYLALHKDMQAELLYPSAFIYLTTSPYLALKRIARRRSEIEGRQCEAGIELNYMERLDKRIKTMMIRMKDYCPVLFLDVRHVDDGKEKTIEELCDEVGDWLATLEPKYDSWQGIG